MSALPAITAATGPEGRRLLRLPSFSLAAGLCLLIGAVFCSSAATAWLQFDREAVAAGQWWRLLTAHLAHYNGENLFWNVSVFALLGWLCEAHDRRRFVACLVASALAISASVWTLSPQLATYRGLSGIDSALFGFLALTMFRAHCATGERWRAAATGALVLGFAAKIAVELVTGRAVFVDSAVAGFAPMPLAHALGAAVGALVALTDRASRRPLGTQAIDKPSPEAGPSGRRMALFAAHFFLPLRCTAAPDATGSVDPAAPTGVTSS